MDLVLATYEAIRDLPTTERFALAPRCAERQCPSRPPWPRARQAGPESGISTTYELHSARWRNSTRNWRSRSDFISSASNGCACWRTTLPARGSSCTVWSVSYEEGRTWTADVKEWPVASREAPTARRQSRTASREPRATSRQPPLASREPRVANRKPRAASYNQLTLPPCISSRS
jgi:hypothetical protein